MNIYATGDTHGDPISRFSYKNNPGLRELTKNDVVIILGDCGLPFGVEANWYNPKEDRYNINWLANKPWTTIMLCGNHDDRCAINKMPIVHRYGGQLRQFTFEGISYINMYYIDSPQILDINNEHILFIPGAESHDIFDGILDPEDDDYFLQKKHLEKYGKIFFRTRNWDWWENESIDIFSCKQLLLDNNDHFDFIMTHDYPSLFKDYTNDGVGRLKPTIGEEYLEELRQTLDFDCWLFGHLHKSLLQDQRDSRLMCLYQDILQIS